MSSNRYQYRRFYSKRKHRRIEYSVCEVAFVYIGAFFKAKHGSC